MMAPTENTEDPGPSTSLIRAFSDKTGEQAPASTLIRSLGSKVQRDRAEEQHIETLRYEWPLLFADADHLAQM